MHDQSPVGGRYAAVISNDLNTRGLPHVITSIGRYFYSVRVNYVVCVL